MSATPPASNGYQPQPGEGITEFTASANPGRNFTSAGLSVTVTFPAPRSEADAVAAIDAAQRFAESLAFEAAERVATGREVREQAAAQSNAQAAVATPAPAPAPAPAQPQEAVIAQAAPAPAPAEANGLPFRTGQTGKGKSFKFLPTDVVSQAKLAEQVKLLASQAGLPSDQLFISDKRRFLEDRKSAPSVAIVMPRQDTALEASAGKNSALAFVYWEDDGNVTVSLSGDGKTAVDQLATGAPAPAPAAGGDNGLPF